MVRVLGARISVRRCVGARNPFFTTSRALAIGETHELQRTPKTAILLLHHGQPRTPYYATQHLSRSSAHFYRLPRWLTSYVSSLLVILSAVKAGFCVDDYKYSKNLSFMIDTYAEILRDYLNVLIPEHRPFHCTYAYLYEEPAIPKTIADLIKMGMEQLILLPLYPHYSCFRTGTMLNTAVEALDEQTLPLAKDGINVMDHRVRPMSHISFRCSTIDRWSTHPALINVSCSFCSSYEEIRTKNKFWMSSFAVSAVSVFRIS
ncbi:unnamed protein product [Gongylonema pulchrum]|uniref:Ferrochelatase n=1 Tax=Gongylonema pulchrum TaxID=637853 RepID=A0A183E6L3_9BILA|nr:unnamed protein product [Gongylonema pulchrum]